MRSVFYVMSESFVQWVICKKTERVKFELDVIHGLYLTNKNQN
jgi:hypothetical protein